MYPNGTHIRQITHPPEGFSDDSPVWSPDGTKVAFHRQATDESTSRIMVLNTKTGDARQVQDYYRVVRGVEGSDPAFSPDGKMLAFKRSSGIWVAALDGSYSHHVTYVEKPWWGERWSLKTLGQRSRPAGRCWSSNALAWRTTMQRCSSSPSTSLPRQRMRARSHPGR